MQNTNTGSGNTQGGSNKPSGLSWSMPPAQSSAPANTNTQSAKPVQSPLPTAAARPASQKPPASSAQSKVKETINNKTKMLVGVIVVVAVVAGGWKMFGSDIASAPGGKTNTPVASDTKSATGGSSSSAVPTTAAANNLTIPSPQDAGAEVSVSSATVSEPTWLVVYELNNGALVRALGATLFFPENNGKGGTISLLRATQPNTAYFVGQSLDNGSHTFAIHVNKDVLDATGAIAGVTFKTK